MRKPLVIALRIIAILGFAVFLYHVFTSKPVPKWTLYVFFISMLLVVALNAYLNLKRPK